MSFTALSHTCSCESFVRSFCLLFALAHVMFDLFARVFILVAFFLDLDCDVFVHLFVSVAAITPSQHVNANVLMKTMFNALLTKLNASCIHTDLFVFFPLGFYSLTFFILNSPLSLFLSVAQRFAYKNHT